MEKVIALIGDVHGQFDKSFDALKKLEEKYECKADFILQAGDLVPVPNENHLEKSYREKERESANAGNFPDYETQKKQIPVPMYFVAGNHEPFSFLEESYPNGGTLCPDLHYLGRSGSKQIEGFEVSYLSGIFSTKSFKKDRPRYNTNEVMSINQMRKYRYFNENDIKTINPKEKPDFLLLHDWPANLVTPIKDGLNNTLNVPAEDLVTRLKPRVVVCGHFHDKKQINEITYSDGSPGMIVTLGGSEFEEDGSEHIQLLKLNAEGIEQIN